MLRLKVKTKRDLMKSVFMILCFCAFVLSMISCEKSVDINFQTNDRRLVVSGEFTSDTAIHSISLCCSGSVTTGRPQTVVSGANIFITDGIDTFTYFETPGTPGVYRTSKTCFGIGGHTYTLDISNVDIDNNGSKEEYTVQTLMPVPVRFDSMASEYGMNGDSLPGSVANRGYYTAFYNGPDRLYHYVIVNSTDSIGAISEVLGSGYLTTHEPYFQAKKQYVPGHTASGYAVFWIEPPFYAKKGDTVCMVGLNFSNDQYEFLKAFDNRTISGDLIEDNMYDQLRIPSNLPTNIKPSAKAAGYFFIYSVSKISKVFEARK